MIHALPMGSFEGALDEPDEPAGGIFIGQYKPWWGCKGPFMDREDDCPLRCTDKRPFEIVPGLYVCRSCWDLELS